MTYLAEDVREDLTMLGKACDADASAEDASSAIEHLDDIHRSDDSRSVLKAAISIRNFMFIRTAAKVALDRKLKAIGPADLLPSLLNRLNRLVDQEPLKTADLVATANADWCRALDHLASNNVSAESSRAFDMFMAKFNDILCSVLKTQGEVLTSLVSSVRQAKLGDDSLGARAADRFAKLTALVNAIHGMPFDKKLQNIFYLNQFTKALQDAIKTKSQACSDLVRTMKAIHNTTDLAITIGEVCRAHHFWKQRVFSSGRKK